ncbi:MAG: nuclear transport factor 2 family protein [Acetobacteraceae bacterium]|nr:nuclear transport factor 2 family protein [Acetobacteraceae bacterium]
MTAVAAPEESPGALVRRFYAARAEAGDPEALRRFLAPDVDWVEPEVGAHMGRLSGAEAVLDMIRRARAATGGTFRLAVVETVETRTHCAALVAWSAERDGGGAVHGRELALFGVSGGRIVSARFHPENISDDRAFWGEAGQGP